MESQAVFQAKTLANLEEYFLLNWLPEDDAEWQPLGHVGRVDRREGEAVAAQLAKLLLGVPQPLEEAVLQRGDSIEKNSA